PVNVVDLGLVYEVQVDDAGNVGIEMTLTSMGCPVQDLIQADAELAVMKVDGVNSVTVDFVWSPSWSPQKLTEDGKGQMRMVGFNVCPLPSPRAAPAADPISCYACSSRGGSAPTRGPRAGARWPPSSSWRRGTTWPAVSTTNWASVRERWRRSTRCRARASRAWCCSTSPARGWGPPVV